METHGALDEEDRKELEEQRAPLIFRPMAQVYHSYNEYRRQEDQENRTVAIGRFIACTVEYDEDSSVPKGSRHKFWVGRVVQVDDDTVTFHYHHTSARDQKYTRSVFKPWTGKNKNVTVGHDAILHVFDALTETGILPARDRNFILGKVEQQVERQSFGRSESSESDDLVVSEVDDDSDIESDTVASPKQSRKGNPPKRRRSDGEDNTHRKQATTKKKTAKAKPGKAKTNGKRATTKPTKPTKKRKRSSGSRPNCKTKKNKKKKDAR